MPEVDYSKLEISNKELLDNIATAGLSAMEFLIKLDAKEDREIASNEVSSLTVGLKALSKNWVDNIVNDVRESIVNLEEMANNPDYKVYHDTFDLYSHYGASALAQLEAKQSLLDKDKAELSLLHEGLHVISPDDRTADSIEIFEDIGATRENLITETVNKALDVLVRDVDDVADYQESIKYLKSADTDKTIDGVQIALNKFLTPQYEEMMAIAGLEKVSEDKDIATYSITGPVDVSRKPEIASLYEEAQLGLEKQTKHEETRVFDFATQLALSHDGQERAGFAILASKLFGTEEKRKLADKQLKLLKEGDKNLGITARPELADNVKKLGNELSATFATGKYELDFDNLKNLSIIIEEAGHPAAKELTKAGQKIMDDASNDAVANLKYLDTKIEMLNADDTYRNKQLTRFKGVPEDLKKTPGRADDYKVYTAELLDELITQDEVVFGRAPYNDVPYLGTDEHPLAKYHKASSQADRFKYMDQLANRYIGEGGIKLLPGEVNPMWDGDKEQIDLFYNILRTFQTLLVLDPIGRYTEQTIGY